MSKRLPLVALVSYPHFSPFHFGVPFLIFSAQLPEQALFDLYEAGHVCLEEALRHADAPGELRMAVQLRSKRARPQEDRLVPLSLEPESPAGAPNPRVAASSAPLT